jgi:hypothetical protein
MSVFHQLQSHVRADETRSAGQEYIHGFESPDFCGQTKEINLRATSGRGVLAVTHQTSKGMRVFSAKRYFRITLAISRKGATLCPSVLDSLTIARHGKSSGELQFSDDLKSD